MGPALPVMSLITMNDNLATALTPARIGGTLLSVLGGLALLLATLGLYGVLSFLVSQRTREIGVRMAIGAGYGDVVRLVIRQGLGLAITGLLLGLVLSFALTRFLSFFLYGVSPTDALTFAGAFVLLGAAALGACYLPARRAARIDPMTALRHD